jgi:heptosyltransferase I
VVARLSKSHGTSFPEPPRSVVVVKLSALGDVCHTLPVVRTLQRAWPEARFTWIIGQPESKLLGGINDIEFIVFNKRLGLSGYLAVHRALRGRRFDLLLHMQFALRASMIATLIRAPAKLGYDRERALDLQWLFTNHRIEPGSREHVMDGLFGFARYCGVNERDYRWDIPVPAAACEHAAQIAPEGSRILIVSPCSSHSLRNWRPEYSARVCDHAASKLGLRVVLCGGRSAMEKIIGAQIVSSMREPCLNLIGQDTLIEFYALLKRALVLLTPDSGPAHMATAAGVPVIGLYAATNAARSGPYFSRDWCVDRFDLAARTYLRKSAAELPWRTKIEQPGVMDLIQPEDVIERLDALAASRLKGAYCG